MKSALDDLQREHERAELATKRIGELSSEKEDLEARVEDLIYKGGSVAEHVSELHQQLGDAEAETKELEEVLGATQQKLARALKDVSEAETGQTEALAEAAALLEDASKVPYCRTRTKS